MIRDVSFGGGVNSVAMILGLIDNNVPIDYIVFADTGGERPETYKYIKFFNDYLRSTSGLEITVISGAVLPQQIKDETLENECLRLGVMPSKAYGFPSCSLKWKIDPHNRWLAAKGHKSDEIIKCIGFDAGEPGRAERGLRNSKGYTLEFPLIDIMDWDRDECEQAIRDHGLPVPPKSACFFCPMSKKKDIIDLGDKHPDLLNRALILEYGSMEKTKRAKGLGRSFNWAEFVTTDINPIETVEEDCFCFDG